MSLIGAIRSYRALTRQQREIVSTKHVQATGTPREWLDIVNGVAEYDRHGDAARSRAASTTFVCVLGLVVCIFVPILWIAAPILVAVGVLAFIVLMVTQSLDLPNNLREFVVPTLRILEQEMPKDAKMDMTIDLRGGTIAEKKQSEAVDDPGWFSYPKVTTRRFLDPWLSATAELGDGSTLRWRITDSIVERVAKKKNYRGKVKTKTKHRVKRTLAVQLAVDRERYAIGESGPVTAGPDTAGAGEFVAKKSRGVFKLHSTIVQTDLETTFPVREFVDTVARAYRSVAPATREAK